MAVGIETTANEWGVAYTSGMFVYGAAGGGSCGQAACAIESDGSDSTMLLFLLLYLGGTFLLPARICPLGQQVFTRAE